MNTNSLLCTVMVVAFGMLGIESSRAFYSPQLGRFVNQDPAGQRPGMGMGRYATTGSSSGGFIERDSIDPMANYNDGMNLYQYVQSNPSLMVDPYGLQGHKVWKQCGGERWKDSVRPGQATYGCCGGVKYKKKGAGKQCCKNGQIGPCGPPPPSCLDEGDWLDCVACCIRNNGMHPTVHVTAVVIGARVPKQRMLPGQARTTSVHVKACQRLRLGKNFVRGARIVGRVGVVTIIADGVYSWGISGYCSTACSGGG